MSTPKTFYRLQQPGSDGLYSVYGHQGWQKTFGTASWHEKVTLETIKCPVFPEHQRAGNRIGTLAVILPSRNVGDFAWTWYSDCLIVDNVLLQFQQAGFGGFKAQPVVIKAKTEAGEELKNIPKLWELIVTGKGGDADKGSGIQKIYTCPHCNLIEYSSFRNGIIVDEKEWDGSDFFVINGYPKFILVTERVKRFVIEHHLTNCELVPSEKLEWGTTIRPEDIFSENSNH